MKKIYLTFLFLMFGALFINAQSNYFYYYKGQKIYLTLDKTKLNIITNTLFDKNTISNVNAKDFVLSTFDNQKYSEIEFINEPTDIEFYQKLNTLRTNPNINHVNLFFKRGDGIPPIGISNIFYIKLKSANDYSLLLQHASSKNAHIIQQVPYMPLWYQLRLEPNSTENALSITNYLWETLLFEDIDPGFMFNFNHTTTSTSNNNTSSTNINCTNDTNFSALWGLDNTVNPNIDINACQAWSINQGLGVKVAVVDGSGIELTHNDLAANIYPLSYNMETGSSPSQVTPDNDHSTHIAGTIAAIKDNNLQVVGVAPQSKIMSVSHSGYNFPNITAGQYASGISWAIDNGADIINCSWGDLNGIYYTTFHSTILENAILNAITFGRNGKGTIVVFASGNNGGIDYPGNFYPDIITVGAINQSGQRAIFPPNQQSAYGEKLDVVAPGFGILSTSIDNSTFPLNGTSMAAPHVSGIAALILSVNPCLTLQQVTTIIETTSQKVGGYTYATFANRQNGTWHNEVGYGLVDAYAAVLMAQQTINPTNPDLYIADSANDFGVEPSTSVIAWNSPDIWVRNQQDTNQSHQSPLYNPSNPNYVYAKVRNRGCNLTTGNDILKIYAYLPNANINIETASYRISNPSFSSNNASSFIENTFSFQEIGSITIPAINSGQFAILSIPWNVPDPRGILNCTSTNFDTFIYTKIVSSTDFLSVPETTDYYQNIINNNNISGKSSVLLSPPNLLNPNNNPNNYESSILISNPTDLPININLELLKEDSETGKLIFQESEVSLKMDETIFIAWQRGGSVSQNLNNTTEQSVKRITTDKVELNNINVLANEIGKIDLKFNFLTSEYTDKTCYNYHLIIRNNVTNSIIGGTTIVINKPIRNLFYANAGENIAIDINEPIVINATEISEPAIYNWYDTQGNLIFTGKDLTIATQVATKYKLEVIANVDGFKDYSEVEVIIKPSTINSISPNPASNNVTITYKLNIVNSAYLMILGSYGTTGTSNNYILEPNSSETNINISNYPNGFYTVALVCNGQIIDAKTLVKQ